MLIGELVEKTGFSKDTIRFYEKQGLIAVGRKQRRHNNYKEYSTEILEKLLAIKRMKNFGFTLNEAAGLLDMIETNDATCNNVSGIITQKIELLDAKIKEMILFRNQLLQGMQKCNECCTPANPDDNCAMLVSDNFPL